MRVNVYAEEITEHLQLVSTRADTGSEFIGVRFYLKTHADMLPPRHPDDDSSAVTFWIKSGLKGFSEGDEAQLKRVFNKAFGLLRDLGSNEIS